jgi:hypothetical protein
MSLREVAMQDNGSKSAIIKPGESEPSLLFENLAKYE